jgi:hypothetical protein
MQNDPYAPPTAPVAEIEDPLATPRRPKWVWVIAVLYVFGGLWSLFITTMMHSGAIRTPPEARAYYDSLSTLDYTLTFLTTALNVIGGILLFRLRAKALAFLAAAVVSSLLTLLYQSFTGALGRMLSGPGGYGLFVGISVALAVIAYVHRLKVKGVLR